jgi:hypothetical protein
MSDEIPIESRDYWLKVIEMLQQNWALIDGSNGVVTVFFVSDTGGVFDEIPFDFIDAAKASLSENGFQRFVDDLKAASFLSPPNLPFTLQPRPDGPIYSSGRLLKGLPKS